MTIVCEVLNFPAMARTREKTRPVNFRLPETLLDELDKYAEEHPLRPTATQVVELALRELLHKPAATVKPAKPKGK